MASFNRYDETIAHPDDDDIVPFKHYPDYSQISLRDIRGNYMEPRGGMICMKVEIKPDTFERRSFDNFQDVFTLETLEKIIESKTINIRNDPAMIMTEMYKEIIPSPLCFVNNVRPFGITSISTMEGFKKHSPAVITPVQISGMLQCNHDHLLDDTLRIPHSLFVLGDEEVTIREHIRLNVFVTVDENYKIKVVLTKHNTLRTWLTHTHQGDKFVEDCQVKKYLAYIKLGYTHDRRSVKDVICQDMFGYWRLFNFIFDPELHWTIVALNSGSPISKWVNITGGNLNEIFKINLSDNDIIKLLIALVVENKDDNENNFFLDKLFIDKSIPLYAIEDAKDYLK